MSKPHTAPLASTAHRVILDKNEWLNALRGAAGPVFITTDMKWFHDKHGRLVVFETWRLPI